MGLKQKSAGSQKKPAVMTAKIDSILDSRGFRERVCRQAFKMIYCFLLSN